MLKYIIMRTQDIHGTQHDLPIMFPKCIVHKEMYENTRRAIRKSKSGHVVVDVVGAGFCRIEGDILRCHGRSESLGVDCRPVLDEQAIMRAEAFSKTDVEILE